MRPQLPTSRLLRGTCAAIFATFAALVAHVAAGGAVPSVQGIGVPLAMSMLLCVPLVGRHLSISRLSAAVVISQGLFHALFMLGTPVGETHVHMHHQGIGLAGVLQGDLAMQLSHMLAAAVTVLFLHRGEAALSGLRSAAERFAAWLRHRLNAPVVVAVLVRAPRLRLENWRASTVLSQIHGSPQSGRGPPRRSRIAR